MIVRVKQHFRGLIKRWFQLTEPHELWVDAAQQDRLYTLKLYSGDVHKDMDKMMLAEYIEELRPVHVFIAEDKRDWRSYRVRKADIEMKFQRVDGVRFW